MAFVNLKKKEVQAKIVYYGPGRGGKTSNLEYIHKTLQSRIQAELVAIKTHGDRTLFFDFLPFDVGKLKNYDVRIMLYTVPGQVYYDASRKLILRGVDGIVFVADSRVGRFDANVESMYNLHENLAEHGTDLKSSAFVVQYNKRDMPDVVSLKDLQDQLASGETHRDGERVRRIMAEIAEHEESLRTLYEHWEEASELNW